VAKPRPVELTDEVAYGEAAARVVAVRAEELAEHLDGVLDTAEIERVHDLRVATRRLRAALEIFEPCFPAKRYKRALRDLKRLADGLGERRDRDVAIASLDEFREKLTEADRPGVSSLIGRLRDEQQEANRALAELVEPDRIGAVINRLRALAKAAREGIRVHAA
jgi:CHAD domain-containing protein